MYALCCAIRYTIHDAYTGIDTGNIIDDTRDGIDGSTVDDTHLDTTSNTTTNTSDATDVGVDKESNDKQSYNAINDELRPVENTNSTNIDENNSTTERSNSSNTYRTSSNATDVGVESKTQVPTHQSIGKHTSP
jgi:hypothetical protein